jgi:gluconokinase
MTDHYFLGVDIGTTGTKALVFSAAGKMLGKANHEYPLSSPEPGWAEQDPKVIFAELIQAIQEAIGKSQVAAAEIAAIGFSGAMHSLIAMDNQNQPLTQAITWADSRSGEQANRLKQDGSGFAVYQRTGTPLHPMSPLTKLTWLREHDAETFQKTAKFISIKEYVLFQLFERYVVDYSIASATGLFNLQALDWDQEALAIAGIHANQLSELVPTTHVLRGIKPEYAEAMGLHPDTPVVIGASDGVLANLGVGAIQPDRIAVTIGTSGAVRQVVQQPLTDPQGRTFCYALTENHWVIGGASNSGGIVLRWFRDRFGQALIQQAQQQQVDPYELMIKLAETVPAGSEGLLFLPFLTGERAPYWNADARGVFFGVALHHKEAHFTRAVLEGILYSVYSIAVVLKELTGGHPTLLSSGGFARSKPWIQMMANVFGGEVLLPEVYEASGFGAAVLAMYAVCAISDLADVQSFIHISDRYQPHPEYSQTYHRLFEIYQRVYSSLIHEFTEIAAYQREVSKLDSPA